MKRETEPSPDESDVAAVGPAAVDSAETPDSPASETSQSELDDGSTLAPQSNNWGSPAEIPKRPDKIGRYTIVRELGSGGQGAVYRAVHPNLPIEVAIKISVKPLDAAYQRALRDEAHILCELEHINIGRVRDLDFHQGRPFMVLDFLRGRSLRERLNAGEVVQEQAVSWLAKIARAIEFAHRRGAVHLDLKPDNIVIDENHEPKVIDFGLARMRGPWNDRATEQDRVSGTLHYMSPEQAEGKAQKIGAHSDIFSLGAVLYRILVGKPPFDGRDVPTMLKAIRNNDFDRETLENCGARPEWINACSKAMSLDPSDRFASAEEFADAIELPSPTAGGIGSAAVWVAVAGLAILLIAVMIALGIRPGGETMTASSVDGTDELIEESVVGQPAAVAKTAIEDFQIMHIGNEKEGRAFSSPLFAERPPLENDDIQVSARFTEPVFVFLFALNPDGVVQLCFPGSESEVQAKPISKLMFPSDDLVFGLTDGAGHQGFVLVTSETPLPSFEDWKSSLGIRWPDESISGDWGYANGNLTPLSFQTAGNSGGSGTRGMIREKQEPILLKRHLDAIGEQQKVEVQGVVFEVQERSLGMPQPKHGVD